MRTESNTRPEPLQIRKLGIIDDEPAVYLYLNDDIKQETRLDDNGETTAYIYDSTHITAPIPATLLPEIDSKNIAYHGYNQTHDKQKTRDKLDDVKTTLRTADISHIKQVDRRDNHAEIDEITLEKIREPIKPISF